MDSVRLGVADLVRQRGSGEISREEFFERLAVMQLPSVGVDAPQEPLRYREGWEAPLSDTSTQYPAPVAAPQFQVRTFVQGPAAATPWLQSIQPDIHQAVMFPEADFEDDMEMDEDSFAETIANATPSSLASQRCHAQKQPQQFYRRPQLRDPPAVGFGLGPGGGSLAPAVIAAPCGFGERFAYAEDCVDDVGPHCSAVPSVASGGPRSAWSVDRQHFPDSYGIAASTPEASWTSSVPFDESTNVPQSLSQSNSMSSLGCSSGQRQHGTPRARQLSRAANRASGPFVSDVTGDVYSGAIECCAGSSSSARYLDSHNKSEPQQSRERSSMDSSFEAFSQRNHVWEMQRQRRCQEMRRQREAEEVMGCSFHPAVSSREPRSSSSGSTIKPSQGTKKGPAFVDALTERLTRRSASAARLQTQAKATWHERKEEEDLKECTFQPDLVRSSRTYQKSTSCSGLASADASMCDFGPDQSSQQEAAALSQSQLCCRSSQADAEQADHAFMPRTNPVRADMVNARSYLQEDVFTRLSNPLHPDFEQEVEDDFCASLLGRSRSETNLVVGRTSQRRAPASSEVSASFLHRQNACDEERRERLAHLEATHAPTLRPEINERSHKINERRRMRELEQERQREQHQRQVGSEFPTSTIHQRQASVGSPNPCDDGRLDVSELVSAEDRECTFRPKITTEAAKMPSKTPEMLSEGDRLRRDKKIDRMREEKRKRDEKEIGDFKPHINDYNGIRGRLQLRSDPDGMIKRMDKHRKSQMQRCQQTVNKLREHEEAQNTFTPKVRAAPAFVRRMAESYRTVRTLKEKENLMQDNEANGDYGMDSQLNRSPSKPDWR